jgi:hypothetical protein
MQRFVSLVLFEDAALDRSLFGLLAGVLLSGLVGTTPPCVHPNTMHRERPFVLVHG